MATLAQLLQTPTQDQIYQSLLSRLQAQGFPVTDWSAGGVEKTELQALAKALLDFAASWIPGVAGGGLVDYASGLVLGPGGVNFTNWMPLLGQEEYNLPQQQATNTVGNVLLSCNATSGPYTIVPSQMIVLFPSGNRYINTTGGTLRPPGFSSVVHTGPGTGTVTPGPGGNTGGQSVAIKIIASGGLGAGTFQFSSDGGASYSLTTTIPGPGVYTDAGTGIQVTFAGTFTAGDTYSFTVFGALSLAFKSEFPNNSTGGLNYTDPSAQSGLVLVTPLPGVTASNPAPLYSPVALVGASSGIVSPSGAPTGTHYVTVRIDVSGQAGVASWSTSVDGAPFVSQGAVVSITNLGGLGINIALSNGTANPSFIAGDTFSFSTPGSWITTQGTDIEPPATHGQRCKNRWPSLASQQAIPGSPTLGFYDLLARQPIAPATTSQVTQTLVQVDATVANKINIYVAGQGGLLPAAALTALQAFFVTRNMITDIVSVLSPTLRTITLGGATVTVKAAQLASAQAAAQAALQIYFNGADAQKPLGINGTIRHAWLVRIFEDTPGVVDFTDALLTINGAVGNFQLPQVAGNVELAQWTQNIAQALNWQTV